VQALALDPYRGEKSLVHHLDPRVKIVITITFILSNVLLPDGAWLAFGLSWLLVLAASHLSGLGWGYVIKRSFIALPFALAAFTIIFTLPGRTLASFDLGPWHLSVSDAGLLRFVSILLRSWLSVQMAVLLAATTKFPDLAHGLRHLHVPAILTAIIAFMYRYLFLLTEEALRLMRARAARSARSPESRNVPLKWRARVAGNMAGQLFLRSHERSDRVYNAMLARGYQGQFLTINPHIMQRADWFAIATILLALALIQFAARWGILL